MERLKYLNVLKELLWSQIESCVHHRTRAFIKCADAVDDMPAACLYGRNTMATRIVARKHIAYLFGRAQLPFVEKGSEGHVELESKASIPYTSYTDYIELDIEHIMQSADKMVLPEVLKHLTSQKNVTGKRHVILLHNIDSMNKNIMHAMRKVLETYSLNAYIIMTCSVMSSITDAIKSRCISINCCLKNLQQLTKDILDKTRPELLPYADQILTRANHDPVNLIILLELPSPDTFKGHLTTFIESRLLEVCTSKSQELLEAKLRDFCTKITAACVPLPMVAQKIIDFTSIHVPEKVHQVVNMATEMEHRTIISNKMLFALELFLHELVILLRPHITRTSSSIK